MKPDEDTTNRQLPNVNHNINGAAAQAPPIILGSQDQQSAAQQPTATVNGGGKTNQSGVEPYEDSVSTSSTPPEAGDVDLIEKAWVEKAKEIVRQTRGDPYNQNKQLSQMKAEYIKKRYNRDMKVSEK